MGRSVNYRQRPVRSLGGQRSLLASLFSSWSSSPRSICCPWYGQRLRLRCACGVLAAPAIRRAGHRPLQNLVSPSFANPLVLLIVSMVIGALFGYASDQLAKVLPTNSRPWRRTHNRSTAFCARSQFRIDSFPRSMDNRSRRPVDFRSWLAPAKRPLIDIAMSAIAAPTMSCMLAMPRRKLPKSRRTAN